MTVIDAATRAPVVDAEVIVLNYVDLMFHPASTNQRGRLRVVYPYAEEPSVNIEVRKEGYVPQRSFWGGDKRKDGPPHDVSITLRRRRTDGRARRRRGWQADRRGHGRRVC